MEGLNTRYYEYRYDVQNMAHARTDGNVNRGRVRTHRRRRTHVKSNVRFITFLIIVMGLCVGIFGFVTGMNESTASVTESYGSYAVESGDTLWDIANRINHKSSDTRKIVHAICQLNDIQAGDLQAGMVLTIPTDM